ncbi:PP2C family protein-serine/threonine phosphatase [Reinekea marinisedimentorum]|uniref:Protein phosphatase n=1 Tax=Reinekea marinisedimentorum TaxID=230495 RepID=A0A4R3ICB6_9GAMM|nr:protein phosphatase 2C domain-containing protein [Reinekea marinisedimentorum]TCS43027.1 protein phosphatase [Reinekea marinisedimentorum]
MPHIDLKELAKLGEQLDATTSELCWESAAKSDVGKVRKVNEDAYICSQEQNLWAVADGMGGHSRGDYASQVVVESLLYFSKKGSLDKTIIEIDSCLKNAHQVCRNTFPSERVGSTVAALYVQSNYCFFLWAGDSRIYRLRDGLFEQLTCDHTLAQQKCARGELSPIMAAVHPSANILTRAIGVNQVLTIEIVYEKALAGDRYLICTDGLYNDLGRKEIETSLAQGSPKEACSHLITSAIANGGRDNTSVIVLDANAPD